MSKLSDTNVAAMAEEVFQCSNDEAWDFVGKVIEADKKDKEAEDTEVKEKRQRYFMVVAPNPEQTEPVVEMPLMGYMIERLPTMHGVDEGIPEEWGDLEIADVLERITTEMREKHSKKGPFESIGDLFEAAPAKLLKEYAIKLVSKNAVSLISARPGNLYDGVCVKKDINDTISIIEK